MVLILFLSTMFIVEIHVHQSKFDNSIIYCCCILCISHVSSGNRPRIQQKPNYEIKIHMKNFRKLIFRMQQISLILLIVSFYIYSFTPNITLLQESLHPIVTAVMILTLVSYIMDSRSGKIDYTANGRKMSIQQLTKDEN